MDYIQYYPLKKPYTSRDTPLDRQLLPQHVWPKSRKVRTSSISPQFSYIKSALHPQNPHVSWVKSWVYKHVQTWASDGFKPLSITMDFSQKAAEIQRHAVPVADLGWGLRLVHELRQLPHPKHRRDRRRSGRRPALQRLGLFVGAMGQGWVPGGGMGINITW